MFFPRDVTFPLTKLQWGLDVQKLMLFGRKGGILMILMKNIGFLDKIMHNLMDFAIFLLTDFIRTVRHCYLELDIEI